MNGNGQRYSVVYPDDLDGRTESAIAWAVVQRLLPSADDVVARLDFDVLAADQEDFVSDVRNGADSTDGNEFVFDPDDEDLLHRIVTLDSPYRNVVLEWLELRRDGDVVLDYVPDHTVLDLDGATIEDALEAVNAALEEHGAAVVEERSIRAWGTRDSHVTIDPPSVCVSGETDAGRTCFSLSGVTAVSVARDERAMQLTWADRDGSLPQRAVGALFDRLGADRPERITFESSDELDAAIALFERLPNVAVERQSGN